MNLPALKTTIRTFLRGVKNAMRAESSRSHTRRRDEARALNPAGHYSEWLREFHDVLRPRVYLEIGVSTGETLNLKRPETYGIGIDPAFSIRAPLENVSVFRQRSDDYFAARMGSLQTAGVDLCFVDGLHEYRQVVRDILNCARICSENAVIVVHDVIPPDERSATAERRTKLWPGDVYKALPFLNKQFPGIDIAVIRTAPTGLAVITSPHHLTNQPVSDEILSGNDSVLDEFQSLSLSAYMADWLPKFETSKASSPDTETVRALVGKRSTQ